MGLSLHWEFSSGPMDAAAASAWVRRLRDYAAGLNFAEVSEVVEAELSRRDPSAGEAEMAERAWAMCQGMRLQASPTPEDPARTVRVPPVHVVAFRAYVAGAEEAAFGLACHGQGGYTWSGGCATQGASKRGGAAAFLSAHRTVVAVLDKARSLPGGVRVAVRDDGGFWETRDPKVLLDKLAEWQSLTSAISRGGKERTRPVTLASDVRDLIEARRRERPRLDRPPVEELEG